MLTSGEWRCINDMILVINSVANIDEMRKILLQSIRMLIPYERAMFYLIADDRKTLQLMNPVFVNVDAALANAYEKTVYNSKYGQIALNLHKSIAYRDTDLMEASIRTNTDVYHSFLKPYDIPFGGGIILANHGRLISEITFFRTTSQGDFTDKDVYIWNILKDHLELRMIRESANIKSTMDYKAKRLKEIGLTNREQEIIWLVIQGYTTAEMSEKLHISFYTTKKHLSNIFVKLNVNSRSQLIQFFSNL